MNLTIGLWTVAFMLLLADCLPKTETVGLTTEQPFFDSTTTEEYFTGSSLEQTNNVSEDNKSNSVEADNNDNYTGLDDFIQEVLEAHNEFRAVYNLPPLELQDELNVKAQSWANHLADIDQIENSLSQFAENIYVESINSQMNGTIPVKFWYDKVKFYTPGKLTIDFWNAASFTQIIWAKTKYLGVGMAESKIYRFVVCFYDPPGNTIGQDPLDESDDYPELPEEKSFYILPGGIYREGNENENLTNSTSQKFIGEVLKAHNKLRLLHGVPPLQIQNELSKESQAWANYLADKKLFYHSNSSHGENIYKEPSDKPINATNPVYTWYNELSKHTFGKEPDWFKVGHFTQLIWSNTEYLGVGIAENDDTRYVVCNYNPRGNIVNQSHYEKLIPPIMNENNSIEEEKQVTEPIIQEHILNTSLEAFRLEVLNAHNEFRIRHGVYPLELKKELNIISQHRAVSLADKKVFGLNISLYGENIYIDHIGQQILGSVPVKHWYDEGISYIAGKEPEDWKKVEHFTQLMWSHSKYLGVGLAANEEHIYIVCNYDPIGNVVGLTDYIQLVPPIGGIKSIMEDLIHYNTTEIDNTDLDGNNVGLPVENNSMDENSILEKLQAILDYLTIYKVEVEKKNEILEKINAIAEIINNPAEHETDH